MLIVGVGIRGLGIMLGMLLLAVGFCDYVNVIISLSHYVIFFFVVGGIICGRIVEVSTYYITSRCF